MSIDPKKIVAFDKVMEAHRNSFYYDGILNFFRKNTEFLVRGDPICLTINFYKLNPQIAVDLYDLIFELFKGRKREEISAKTFRTPDVSESGFLIDFPTDVVRFLCEVNPDFTDVLAANFSSIFEDEYGAPEKLNYARAGIIDVLFEFHPDAGRLLENTELFNEGGQYRATEAIAREVYYYFPHLVKWVRRYPRLLDNQDFVRIRKDIERGLMELEEVDLYGAREALRSEENSLPSLMVGVVDQQRDLLERRRRSYL